MTERKEGSAEGGAPIQNWRIREDFLEEAHLGYTLKGDSD